MHRALLLWQVRTDRLETNHNPQIFKEVVMAFKRIEKGTWNARKQAMPCCYSGPTARN